jgi:transposase
MAVFLERRRRLMSLIIRFGLDLAKNSFAICGVDAVERIQIRKTLSRSELLIFFSQQAPAIVAMESGSGAHHWARSLRAMGHEPRIIDPRFVAPYRRQGTAGKNDTNDAEAICEAAGRPRMRFVPIKRADQQAHVMVHRIRASVVTDHTRTINQLRGLLAEFGIVVARGADGFKRLWPEIRQRFAHQLPLLAWEQLDALYFELGRLHERILEFDRRIKAFVREDEAASRLAEVPGIGIMTASALVASVGNARDFKNGRQFAAWLGLVPRQSSTGGVARLGRITKRGDRDLRTLLVHGARSEMTRTANKLDPKSRWAESVKRRKGWNKAAVALANKHARIVWSMLAHHQPYQPAELSQPA